MPFFSISMAQMVGWRMLLSFSRTPFYSLGLIGGSGDPFMHALIDFMLVIGLLIEEALCLSLLVFPPLIISQCFLLFLIVLREDAPLASELLTPFMQEGLTEEVSGIWGFVILLGPPSPDLFASALSSMSDFYHGVAKSKKHEVFKREVGVRR